MSRPTAALLAALSTLACAAPAVAAPVAAPDGETPRRFTGALRATAAAGVADPRLPQQWAFSGDGAMGARTAWAQTTGGEVIVAVVDSGVDLRHADLAPNLWRNPREVAGNGLDDDRNGVADDVHGWDAVDHDGDPSDHNGHGTHVAGIVAARGANHIGGRGVAWRARIMAVRVLDAEANGDTTDVARGVRYAVSMGARIINLSLAGTVRSHALESALAYARNAGALVVAAAGNEGTDLAAVPFFPASYPLENVIGVAASTSGGSVFSLSNFGNPVELAAPGTDILSTAAGGGTEWRSGTSMAAPYVTGAAVLLKAARPDLDWRGLRAALLTGARRRALPVGTGALDAAGALRQVVPADKWRTLPKAKPRARKSARKRKRSRR